MLNFDDLLPTPEALRALATRIEELYGAHKTAGINADRWFAEKVELAEELEKLHLQIAELTKERDELRAQLMEYADSPAAKEARRTELLAQHAAIAQQLKELT